jgi:hypothetical protein
MHHKPLFTWIINLEVTFTPYFTSKILFFYKERKQYEWVHISNIYQANKLIKINVHLLHHNWFLVCIKNLNFLNFILDLDFKFANQKKMGIGG